MATVSGTLTIQCSTLDEYNGIVAQVQAAPQASNIQLDQANLKITFFILAT